MPIKSVVVSNGVPKRKIPAFRGLRQIQCASEHLEPRVFLSASFSQPVYLGGTSVPTGIATADFNGDGQPDVVLTGYDPTVNVPVMAVYLNQNGSLTAPTGYPFAGTPGGVATGNFLGNGKQEIAVIDSSTNNLIPFENDGHGNFTAGPETSLGGSSGDSDIVSADFSNNGRDDIAVVDPSNQAVNVYFSNGDGTFTLHQSIPVPSPLDVVVGDFNGDSAPDLAVLSSNGSAYVALNNGSGELSTATPYNLNLGVTPTAIAAANLNGSGQADLVAIGSSSTSGALATLLSQSGGTFSSPAVTTLSINPDTIVPGQFTSSGFTDLALFTTSGTLEVLPGNGNGTFQSAQTIFNNTLNIGTAQAVSGDFSGAEGIAFLTTYGFGVTTSGSSSGTSPPAQTLTPTLTGTLPSSAIAGVSFAAHENLVLTAGSAAVNGNASATLLLSPDTSAADSVLTLGSASSKFILKANKSRTLAVKPIKSVPRTVAAGTYHVLIELTDTAGTVGTIDTGKTLSVAAPVVDLTGSFVTATASAKANKKFTIILEIANASDANVSAVGALPIEIETSLDGLISDATPLLSQTRRINLKPGRSVRLAFSIALASSGFLVVDLDPGNAVFTNDLNPANNIFATMTAITVS